MIVAFTFSILIFSTALCICAHGGHAYTRPRSFQLKLNASCFQASVSGAQET